MGKNRRRWKPALLVVSAGLLKRAFTLSAQVQDLCFAYFNGLWLGALTREDFHLLGDADFARGEYRTEDWNRRGLFSWEEEALRGYFTACRALLVAGAGGGREVLALRRLGYDADGFDCNPALVAGANALLAGEGMAPDIVVVPPDRGVETGRVYDGLIVGWGAYSHIQGRAGRVRFLREMRRRVAAGGPLLLSFGVRTTGHAARFRITALVAGFLRRLLGREPVEFGDSLSGVVYAHYFSRDEIVEELRMGGFEPAGFLTRTRGAVVGTASRS